MTLRHLLPFARLVQRPMFFVGTAIALALSLFLVMGPGWAEYDSVEFDATLAVWRLSMLFPLLFGVILGSMVREGQGMLLNVTLPGARVRHMAGLVVASLPVIVFALALHGPNPALVGLAGVTVTLLSYGVGVQISDSNFASRYWMLVLLPVVILYVRADLLVSAAAQSAPLPVALVCIAGTIVLFRRDLRPEVARVRALVAHRLAVSSNTDRRIGPLRSRMEVRDWTAPLAKAPLRAWMHAARYESEVGRRFGLLIPLLVFLLLFGGVYSVIGRDPVMPFMLVGFLYLSFSCVDFHSDHLYPISRAERAEVAYRANAAYAIVCVVVALTVLMGMARLLTNRWLGNMADPFNVVHMTVAMLIVAPVGQRHAIKHRAGWLRSSKRQASGILRYAGTMIVFQLAYFAAMVILEEIFERNIAAFVVIAVTAYAAAQYAFRSWVTRLYAKQDLVRD